MKSKGRMSLRVATKAAPAPVRPATAKPVGKVNAAKVAAKPVAKTAAKAPKRKKAGSK